MGGAVHPILLNKLFNGPIGFHHGVRASAMFLGGLLIIGNLLMRPRLPPSPRKGGSTFNDLKTFARDVPYALTVFGCVLSLLNFPFHFLLELAESRSY